MNMENQDEPGALPPNPEGLDSPSGANHIDFRERGSNTRPRKSFAVALLAVVVFAGAVYIAGDFGKNLPQNANYSVPSAGTNEFFMKEGQSGGFDFAGHRIVANYLSASPDHSLDVTVDGVLKSIGVARNSQCVAGRCASSWTYKGMNFVLEPVIRGQDGLSFGTWDTSELRLSVS